MCAVRVRVWYMPLRGLFDATISFIDALTALKLAFEIMHECMLSLFTSIRKLVAFALGGGMGRERE